MMDRREQIERYNAAQRRAGLPERSFRGDERFTAIPVSPQKPDGRSDCVVIVSPVEKK